MHIKLLCFSLTVSVGLGITAVSSHECWCCIIVLQFMNQKQFGIPESYCDAVMHCKDGAAMLILQALYQLLTSRQ